MLGDTGNKRSVCILLECILVYDLFLQGWEGHGPLALPTSATEDLISAEEKVKPVETLARV